MARKKNPTLTEAELRLMKVVWEKDRATVSEVLASLPSSNELAYNTVLTTLRILEKKGYLRHEKDGRAHVFRPIVSRNQACQNAVRHMVKGFFNNSPEALMLSILEHEELDQPELDRLKQMIDNRE
ncbi:MAG: BlaI/MecI/CopY family transcriptional regulator [candidate division Zixibacteria bacterium]|nr:BlaI/MecI/CopY family transcriptional regulator [candidate division Zixibacteria bacterium]